MKGLKKDKTRMTLALISNADGSHKLVPFIIGHAAKPQCFKKKTGEELGFDYCNNSKAWMTGVLFQEWLQHFNDEIKVRSKFLAKSKMTLIFLIMYLLILLITECLLQDRRVLLLLDNAPSHVTKDLVLSNVHVQMLPPNTTSWIPPMDAGIISAFKRHYRRFHLQNAVLRDECSESNVFHVDQLTAMNWSLAAWNEIIPQTIINCFKHTGLFTFEEAGVDYHDSIEAIVERDFMDALRSLSLHDPMSMEVLLNPVEEEEAAHMKVTTHTTNMIEEVGVNNR